MSIYTLAWRRLVEYLSQKGISRQVVSEYLRKAPPSSDFPGNMRIYKTLMAGYYLIATQKVPDKIINDVYSAAYTIFDDIDSCEYPIVLEIVEQWGQLPQSKKHALKGTFEDCSDAEGWIAKWEIIRSVMTAPKKTRLEKINAIEQLIHAEHERGNFIEYFWGDMYPEVSGLSRLILDTLAR